AGANVIVCADAFYRRGSLVRMEEVARETGAEHVIVVPRVGQGDRSGSWNDLGGSQDEIEDTDAEDPFMIAYTSGTTGRPKGSVHVHGGFLTKIAAEVAYQTDYRRGETLFWFTDPGWIMGPWEMVGTLALGGTIFLYDGAPNFPGPDRWWD